MHLNPSAHLQWMGIKRRQLSLGQEARLFLAGEAFHWTGWQVRRRQTGNYSFKCPRLRVTSWTSSALVQELLQNHKPQTANVGQRKAGIFHSSFIECFPLFRWSFVLDLFLQRDPRGLHDCVFLHSFWKATFWTHFLGVQRLCEMIFAHLKWNNMFGCIQTSV